MRPRQYKVLVLLVVVLTIALTVLIALAWVEFLK